MARTAHQKPEVLPSPSQPLVPFDHARTVCLLYLSCASLQAFPLTSSETKDLPPSLNQTLSFVSVSLYCVLELPNRPPLAILHVDRKDLSVSMGAC